MKIVVIGASAAGLKAACRVRRLLSAVEVSVLEEGQHISYAACGMPYLLSADIDEARQLMTTAYDVEKTPAYFTLAKDVQVLTGVRAERIDTGKQIVVAKELATGKELEFPYDHLVLATGASPVIPAITGVTSPGVCAFTRLEDALALRQAASKGELARVAIVGAGYIGCELCEAFKALWGIDTVLFEQEVQILPQLLDPELARIAQTELEKQGIEIHLGVSITAISPEDGKLAMCTNANERFTGFDRVVLATGVRPRTELAQTAGVAVGIAGGVIVDAQQRTNIPNIYAAGDCALSKHAVTGEYCQLPLGSLANRMGRTAANTIASIKDEFGPVCGASCLKVFDLNIAAAGISARQAKISGYEISVSWGVFTDKAHYYPEAKLVSAKLVFETETLRVLGFQIAGSGEVIREVDAMSNFIRRGATLKELWDFEPAYAPPYANALSPIHFLAYAGVAQAHRKITAINPLSAGEYALDAVVIDVREDVEIREKPCNYPARQLLTIPFTQIRSRMGEIPKNKTILVICQRGTRSAETVRILKEAGFEQVRYLGGGLGFFLD